VTVPMVVAMVLQLRSDRRKGVARTV
jgi:hypothetical protein